MPPRKHRIRVVFDTNVLIGFYLGRNPQSANARIWRLWRDVRDLQLIVSDEIIDEYMEIVERLQVGENRQERLAQRLQSRDTVTHVQLGPRFNLSRDPDDNVFLAAAKTGGAKFLVSNDHHLLDIPESELRAFRFEIVTPPQLLARLSE